MTGLLTDLYELTMAAGYFEAGKQHEIATFELSIRRLPRNRDWVILCGLGRAVEYLQNLRFSEEEIRYLRSLPQFALASEAFFDYLRRFRFHGDVWTVPEGTLLFAGEPVMNVRAPMIEAQIPETYLLAALTFETLIATKAALVVESAQGRAVVEFGTRRAHTAEAGVLGARAAYIGGCTGTSNALTGLRFGVPVMGTCAHSWVLSFPGELEAFQQLQRVMGPATVHLVDTYDAIEGTRRAVEVGRPLWGIRIDSGDFVGLSRAARSILDAAGLTDVRIMVSGDLDEHRIREVLAAGAPIDAFGVGTELATSADAPSMGSIYKLVEIESHGVVRYTAKHSSDKATLPGAKQIFRLPDMDVVGLADEPCPESAAPLLIPLLRGGELIAPLPGVEEVRRRAAACLDATGRRPRPVAHSDRLRALIDKFQLMPQS